MIIPFQEERAEWVDVLVAIYGLQFERADPTPAVGGPDEVFATGVRIDDVAGATGIDPEVVPDALVVLRDLGLAAGEIADGRLEDFGLTVRGIEVAHRIKAERQQRRTNQHLVSITVLLLVILAAGFVL